MADPTLTIVKSEPSDAPLTIVKSEPTAAAPSWYQPGGDAVLDNVRNAVHAGGQFIRGLVTHPVETGATAGAIAAVPLTGGASLLPAVAAATLGGAGGAGLGMLADAAHRYVGGAPSNDTLPTDAAGVAGEMGKQGAIQGAAEGGGRMIQGALRMAGRALYPRFPVRLTEKYGDLQKLALDEAAPVGASRAVQGDMTASKNAVTDLAQQAQTAGRSVPASAVTDKYLPLVDTATKREELGVPGDITEIAAREQSFNRAHQTGQIAPARALDLKRESDVLASTAQNQLRRGVTPTDMTAQLHNATRAGLNEGLDTATAGMTTPSGLTYGEQNARTSQLYGLSRGLRTIENQPHRLTDLATLGTGLATASGVGVGTGDKGKGVGAGVGEALLMRALLSPAVNSRAAIASWQTAGLPMAQLLRAAVLARLTATDSPTPEPPTGR